MAVVDLLVRIKDQASSGIGRIGNALQGLGGRANDAARGTSGLSQGLTGAILQAQAVTFGIQKATEAIGFLNNKFEESRDLQVKQVNAASTFSVLTGQSFAQASLFVERLNERLAKSAAILPGTTAGYKQLGLTLQDNLLEAFKDPSGTLNQKGFEDALVSISESFGALTAASTNDISNTALGLSKALGGGNLSELRQIAFFEQNPVIFNEIDRRLKSMGKELKDLNVKERVELLQQTGAKYISGDFRKYMSETAESLIQGWTSYLFDNDFGTLGLNRDIDLKTEGIQSAFSSMNEALKELIGSSGLFYKIGDFLTAAGIKLPDPMAALKSGVDFFVNGVKQVNRGLSYLTDFVKAGGTLGDSFRLATTLLAPKFSVDSITAGVMGFIKSTGDRIGDFMDGLVARAAPLFNQGVSIVSSYFGDMGRMNKIGIALGQMMGRVAGAAINFLAQVDYPQLLAAVGNVAIGLLSSIYGVITGFQQGVQPGLYAALENALGGIGDGFRMVVLAVGQTFTDGIRGAGLLITESIKNFSSLGTIVSTLIGNLIDAGKNFLIREYNSAVQNLGMSGLSIQTTPTAASSPALPGAMMGGGRYAGNAGFAANGFVGNLLTAARREMAMMPTGAQLLVANSSETIIPQDAMAPFLRGLSPAAVPATGRTGGVTIGAVNLTINESATPQSTADAVIAAIQARFEAELLGQFG